MSSGFSPSRSPASSRAQLGSSGASRLRSSSSRKPPEPLRRAVADYLSSSSPATHAGSHSAVVSEASRTLRDYLASSITTDLAYSIILEHTLAERERSPAVVARCVVLLKRYLLRYKPSEETLQQIDRFCVHTIAECDISLNRRLSPWSQSLNQQSGASMTHTNNTPLPASSFASAALVKSLNYIRSLVAQHIPKRSFQPAAFGGAPPALRQSLPTLSSLLSKSFNKQFSPASGVESSEKKDASIASISNTSSMEKVDGIEDLEFIAVDVLKWRWAGEQQSSVVSVESDRALKPQDISAHNFLEVGAAALLLGDMETKMKAQTWRPSETADMPSLDQMLQPSSVTAATNSTSVRPHLRAITATKRSKQGPHQIWIKVLSAFRQIERIASQKLISSLKFEFHAGREDSLISTFRPRAQQLFQYRHYSEQQPLRLNPAEVCEVIAAVCSETSASNANLMTVSSRLSKNSGKPLMDVAVSVLIKLVIDMYVLDSKTAAPLTLSMLEEMIGSPRSASRVCAFDLILNLGVHAHLLEPMMVDDTSTIEEDYSEELYLENESQFTPQVQKNSDSSKFELSSVDKFELWILSILYEILLLLVQREEKEESVWASGFSCLLYFVCSRGKIRRSRLKGLDIRVVKVLLEISRNNCWAEVVHCKLICMLTNMFYQVSVGTANDVSSTPIFLVDQVYLIGGIEFVFFEYSLANSREERRNLYLVLFDYVLHEINETCTVAGVSEYGDDEIQPLAILLTLANAAEAFYISVKLGVEGIGEILRRSISHALSRYSNGQRLNTLLEKITEKFDSLISSFTHLDTEFSHMTGITKSYKFINEIEDRILGSTVAMKAKLSWATLHSLLHSERIVCRQNACIWLGDLLIAEISLERDASIWSNIQNLQQQISVAGVNESSVSSDIPLPVWLLCGLLKSKHNNIRWCFLFILERLLMQCKFLLDENELQHTSTNERGAHESKDSRLDKANAVIDIMSSALSLVAQINETDRMIILKMCDILFSQLCLKVLPASAMPSGDVIHHGKIFGCSIENKISNDGKHASEKENYGLEESLEKVDHSLRCNDDTLIYETASMAALLLQGQAIVPMQLISRVPAALFYWPLIQLAGAATDNIALGVAVGSKGRGNLPGATSDIRATLLLLLIGNCTADPAAFQEIGGEDFFRELLDDTDSRVAYYSSAFLLKRMMTEEPEKYQRMLQNLVFKAQQSNNEKLLENPYLQMRGILQLSNDLGTGL